MAVDVDDATHPLDADAADLASSGAAEFRALKAKVKSLYLNTKVGITQAHLIDTEKGINAIISSAVAADLFGGASIITRTANAIGKNLYGFLAQGILGNNVSQATLNGLNVEARIGTGCTVVFASPIGALLTQQSHNLNATIAGVTIVFADRISTGIAAPGGLGNNWYNRHSSAILIDSFVRSSAGEYCGWKTGILFTAPSMDRDIDGPGYCIDFSNITYLGGTDPNTAYAMKGVIKMREMQAIRFDITELSALYIDPSNGRLTFSWGGIKRWEMDVNNGDVYKNGVFQY